MTDKTYRIYWTTKEPTGIVGGLGMEFDESEVDEIAASLNLRHPHLRFWGQPEDDEVIYDDVEFVSEETAAMMARETRAQLDALIAIVNTVAEATETITD
jgi:hypothetical protein